MSLTASSQNVPKIMVFRPTIEEMQDFSGYISYMESQGAHKAGLAKVIPPKEFVPRKNYDNLEMVIPAPIQQEVMGHQGLYTQYNIQKKAMTVKEFARLANSAKYQTPPHFDYEDLERKYWKNITYNPPIYGADISGSIYDAGINTWNINKLNTILDIIEEEQGVKIEGVNTAYLYFGMWKTTFAWHTEDLDLYSINYLHYGAPKSWYAIPPQHGKRLERLASGFFPGNFKICSNFLRHKMSIIAPHILKKYSIPFNKITQEKGEFMITFPYGYHAGFNHGYNCAESTNFASLRWINYGKRATHCTCQKDSVKISMEPFVRVFQPDRYEPWKTGKDSLYIAEVDNPTGMGSNVKHMKEPPLLPFTTKSDEMPRRHPVHKKDGRRNNSPNALPKKKKKDIKVEAPEPAADGDGASKSPSKKSSAKKKLISGEGDAPSSSKAADVKVELKKKVLKKESVKKKNTTKDAVSPKKRKSDAEGGSPTKKKKTDKNGQAVSAPQEKKKTKKKPVKDELVITPTAELRAMKAKKKPKKESKPKSQSNGKTKAKATALRTPDTEDTNSLPSSSSSSSSGSGDDHQLGEGGLVKETNRWVMFDHRYYIKNSSQQAPSKHYKHKHQPRPSREEEGRRQMVRMRKGKDRCPSPPRSAVALLEYRRALAMPEPGGLPRVLPQAPQHTHSAFTMKESRAMKDWARSLNSLWVTQPSNVMMETVHNASMSDQKPGCCVCQIFYHDKLGIYDEDDNGKTVLVGSSQDYKKFVLTPEDCFAATSENRNPVCTNPLIDDEACSPILTCSSCHMAVHASCYGQAPIEDSKTWTCQRCLEEDWPAVCCLCNLRGGALKHTTNNRWAHITCAMAIPEVSFVNVLERQPIDCSNISEARLKLKCFFCRSFIKYSPKFGSCIQCSVGKCAISFHVTCANAAGVVMEPGRWPCAVFATCIRHPGNVKDWTRIRKLKEIHAGDHVVAKHKNNRYYKSVVKGEKAQLFCHVEFKEDQSFCDNLYPEDIESHNIAADGPPEIGSDVQVRWVDGEVYAGTFVNSYATKMYVVQFEDGSIIVVKKEDIYKEGEPMPKRVRSRMSEATEKRYMGFDDLAKVSGKGKQKKEGENGASQPSTSTSTSSSSTSSLDAYSRALKEEDVDVTGNGDADETSSHDDEDSKTVRVKQEVCSPMKSGQWTTGHSPSVKKEVVSPAKSNDGRQLIEVTLKEEDVDIDAESTFTESDSVTDSKTDVAVTMLALPASDGDTTPTLQGATLVASTSAVKSEGESSPGDGHVSFPNDASLRLDNISLKPGEALPPSKRFF